MNRNEKVNPYKFMFILIMIFLLSSIVSPLLKKVKLESLYKKINNYCDITLDYYEDYYMYYDCIDLDSEDIF